MLSHVSDTSKVGLEISWRQTENSSLDLYRITPEKPPNRRQLIPHVMFT